MATTSDIDPDRAAEDASRWLIALQEAPDDAALRNRFDAWLVAAPGHAEAWRRTAQVYAGMGQVAPRHRDRWVRHAARRTGIVPMAPSRRRAVLGAAAAALAACLAIVVAPTATLHLDADYLTGTGELRRVALDDGSVVHLAPDSAVEVAYGTERRLRLLRGRAFFEVASEPQRPFRVEAADLTATVLGTGFEVRQGESGSEVAVAHGRVGVTVARSATPAAELGAGQWLRATAAGAVEHGERPAPQIAAWRAGQLIARDRPVAEVVDELRAYYGGYIILASDMLGARRLTGVYSLADPEAALRAIASAHGAVVRRLSPWLLVLSAG